jgi:hypothetical protein
MPSGNYRLSILPEQLSKSRLQVRLTLVAELLKENGKGDKPFRSSSSARFALLKLNNFNPRIIREPLIYLLFEFVNRVAGEHLNLVVHRTTTYKDREAMLVFSDREIISEGEKEAIVERFEALQLGIALRVSSLVDTRGRLFDGGTLRDHLLKNQLA